MPAYNFFAGEARFKLGGTAARFRATEPLEEWDIDDTGLGAREDVTRLGSGTLAARIFIGLNIGGEEAIDTEEIIDFIIEWRTEHGDNPSMSVLTQRGVYQNARGEVIQEPSLQIVILEFGDLAKNEFANEMTALGEALAEAFEQDEVIVEIQKRGVVRDVFSTTPKRRR
jgi:hypothetical protein